MTARLTIVLDPGVLNALRGSNSITVVAGTPGGPAASRNARATRDTGVRPGGGGFREGSLPARLMEWAGPRKEPFTVPEVMKAFKIKRGHASMLLAYARKGGAVKRVGRGEYAAS